ncbi:hypothetical protein RF11_12210 [Thelohanellus kitauei]|uniref:Uncharacterized protein n=1 Tax=Thelohanellus kitauei TaxID=669202 RepID=A0A0C2NAJ8_THEKT|nr:hypothetical protein RF11_12210 [Thelohanellus kitauei]
MRKHPVTEKKFGFDESMVRRWCKAQEYLLLLPGLELGLNLKKLLDWIDELRSNILQVSFFRILMQARLIAKAEDIQFIGFPEWTLIFWRKPMGRIHNEIVLDFGENGKLIKKAPYAKKTGIKLYVESIAIYDTKEISEIENTTDHDDEFNKDD